MNKSILSIMIGLSLAISAHAQNPSWIDESAGLTDQALSAKQNGISPGEAAVGLVRAGSDAEYSVQAVVVAYGSCPSLEDAVREVVSNDPGAAYDVVAGVLNLESCPCSADNVWPHTRLESRVRVPTRRFETVGLGGQSNCLSIAANAAVKAAPNQARAVLAAATGDTFGRPGSDLNGRRVVDSVGEVGKPRENWQGDMAGKAMTLERKDTSCTLDRDPTDVFTASADWVTTPEMSTDSLGEVTGRCRERSEGLVISEFQTDGNASNVVEVSNKSPIDVDLARGRFVLDVYADGSNTPKQSIALTGKLKAGASLVVADSSVSDGARQQAEIVMDDLRVENVNAVVLRRIPVAEENCQNVPLALGMIATALGDDGEKWLDDTASEYASDNTSQQIDAIGTVGIGQEDWLGAKAGQPLTVSRQDSTCEGDSSATDSFSGAPGWRVEDGVVAAAAASERCMANARDLVLSEYQNDAERYRSVSVLNNTGGKINLEDSGYVLEVYADGASTPSSTIQLKGQLANGQALVVVDEDAPADVKERANLVSSELSLAKINALVLRKMSVSGGKACQTEIVASARDIRLPLDFASGNTFAPSRAPNSDDTLAAGRRGGEVASPN